MMIFPEKIDIHISKLAYILLLILFFLSVILYLLRKSIHNKKINNIIKSYRDSGYNKKTNSSKKIKKISKKSGVSDFSLGERKSGLTWSGGNIKGANATRGTKRQFLKKG